MRERPPQRTSIELFDEVKHALGLGLLVVLGVSQLEEPGTRARTRDTRRRRTGKRGAAAGSSAWCRGVLSGKVERPPAAVAMRDGPP